MLRPRKYIQFMYFYCHREFAVTNSQGSPTAKSNAILLRQKMGRLLPLTTLNQTSTSNLQENYVSSNKQYDVSMSKKGQKKDDFHYWTEIHKEIFHIFLHEISIHAFFFIFYLGWVHAKKTH